MKFRNRKLPKGAADRMRRRPLSSVKPFELLFAPAYVLLKRNEKFVSVKGPWDFFVAKELEKLRPFESLYFPEVVDQMEPFSQAGRQVRSLLSIPALRGEASDTGFSDLNLDAPPFEVSDEVLRIVGPLWSYSAGRGPVEAVIEPFFVAVFVNALCDVLPEEVLIRARDLDVDSYETAVFRSAWAVFTAIHLGHCDLGFLNSLRTSVFESSIGGDGRFNFVTSALEKLSSVLIPSTGISVVGSLSFISGNEDLTPQLFGRIQRVLALSSRDASRPSVYGEKGFLDV